MFDETSAVNNRDPLAAASEPPPGGTPPRPFTEPKLRFIEPQLTKRGDLSRVTAELFGPFSPDSDGG